MCQVFLAHFLYFKICVHITTRWAEAFFLCDIVLDCKELDVACINVVNILYTSLNILARAI